MILRRFFSKLWVYLSLFLFALPAQAVNPKEIYCSGPAEGGIMTFVHMIQDSATTYQVSTETTLKYLMGLNCEFPTESVLAFRCRGDQNIQLNFYSQHVIEEGYDSTYSRFAKEDYLKFTVYFTYSTNQGESKEASHTRRYLTRDCLIK